MSYKYYMIDVLEFLKNCKIANSDKIFDNTDLVFH